MQKKFLSNLIFFLTLNLIIKPIYVFGIDRVVQNRVGVEEYGNYFALFNFILILQIILDLGIENFNRKEIAQSPGKVSHYFSLTVPLKIILGFLYLIVCAAIAFFRGFSKEEWNIFLILVGNQFMASFILYLRANLGGLHLFKLEGIVSVFDRGLMILLCGYILFAPNHEITISIKWFVLCQTFAYAATLLLSLLFVVAKARGLKLTIHLKQYLPVLKGLTPFAILVLLQAFYFRIDSVLLDELLLNGEVQAGIYAHAFRYIELLTSYALLFPILLLPLFSRQISEKTNPIPLLKLGIMILLIPSFIFLTAVVAYRYDIFAVLYDSYIEKSADTFAILCISFLGMCVSYTFGALLTANKNLKQLIYMSLSAVVLSTVLNILFIPKFEVIGAAIANAGAQLFCIIIHVLLVRKVFSFYLDYRTIIRLFLSLGLTIGIAYFIKLNVQNWLWGIVIISICGIAIAAILKTFNIRSFLEAIKE